MRPLVDMDTIQIEITNICPVGCSNCTRLVGHYSKEKTYFMDIDMFKKAVDSMEGFPKMVGIMGGEPLLHPKFEELCEYALSKFPPEQLGLWTCFPKGKEHHREVIVKTFGNIFLNDHTRADIMHCPVLVPASEIPGHDMLKWHKIHHCWVQNSWSAAINPKGAFFCEIAAALDLLLDLDRGWTVEKGWWTRSPMHFNDQINTCMMCGAAMPLKMRKSTDKIDDISIGMYNRLKDTSPKLKAGLYRIHELDLCNDNSQMATYKDPSYRDAIAKRYGMFLTVNEKMFNKPHLLKKWSLENEPEPVSVR